MIRIHAIALLPAFMAVVIGSCASIDQRRAAQRCRFEIARVDVADFSLSYLNLSLLVNVTNPGKRDAVIDRMDLDLYIENKKTVNVIFDGITVPSGETRSMNAIMAIPFSIMGMQLADATRNNGGIHYRLAGIAYMKTAVGVVRFPVTITKK